MSKSTEEINELIANGQRLVREAEEVLAKSKRFFAEHDIDPRDALGYVRRHGGEAAAKKVEAQVKEEIQRVEEEAQRRRLHAPKVRPPGKRPRMPSNMI